MTEPGGRRCEYVKVDGRRCETFAVDGSPYCFFHDPNLEEQRTRARLTGGRNRKTPRPGTSGPPPSIEGTGPVAAMLRAALEDAWQLDPSGLRIRSILAIAETIVASEKEYQARVLGWLPAAIAAAKLDADQLGRLTDTARRLDVPEEAVANLRPTDVRPMADIELASRLLFEFGFAFDATVRPELMDGARAIESREGLETFLIRKVKPVRERLADLRDQGREAEAGSWMKFLGRLTEFLMQVIEIARPELLRPAAEGGCDD